MNKFFKVASLSLLLAGCAPVLSPVIPQKPPVVTAPAPEEPPTVITDAVVTFPFAGVVVESSTNRTVLIQLTDPNATVRLRLKLPNGTYAAAYGGEGGFNLPVNGVRVTLDNSSVVEVRDSTGKFIPLVTRL